MELLPEWSNVESKPVDMGCDNGRDGAVVGQTWSEDDKATGDELRCGVDGGGRARGSRRR
uniref:DUF834 domain-containing protein n=1 Tax=Oryza glumipatula TaxID=40148 RepID=A0A0E0B1R2_9ORYZ